jgi:predicted RNase H-like HicB family nuclease
MNRHFPVIIEQDSEGIFLVECPLFKGCRSYGHTIEEAMLNIREAIEACLAETSFLPENTIFVGVRDLEMATP